MPPAQQVPDDTRHPTFDEARSLFAGKRGGTGDRAAAGTAATAQPQRHAEISSGWIRPGNVSIIQQREAAKDPGEQEYIRSLLMDADWLHRFGTRRFTRGYVQF